MNRKDLYGLGDIYGNLLDGVSVVEESGPGDKELNKGTGLEDGGPKEKGGFGKKKLDPDECEEDNEFDVKRFSYPDDEDECDEEDEEIMVESVQHLLRVFSESAEADADVIKMIVEMGRASVPNLRTVIHNLNKTNKSATVNLLTALNESSGSLIDECKAILKKVVAYDKNMKQPINESRKGRVKAINKGNMKKSSFDKLFESVMDGEFDELDELGVDTNDEFGDLGDDLESDLEDGGDEVTFTLDRATAQALCDVLSTALGDGEMEDIDDLEGEDEFGGDEVGDEADFTDEDEERVAGGVAKGEGIPAEAGVPKQKGDSVDMGKKNKRGNLNPAGAASAKGEGIPAAAGVPKQHSKAVNMGKQNKVSKLTPGKRMFD